MQEVERRRMPKPRVPEGRERVFVSALVFRRAWLVGCAFTSNRGLGAHGAPYGVADSERTVRDGERRRQSAAQ